MTSDRTGPALTLDPALHRRRGRPAAVRLVRRAHGPLRLHRHLRTRPPDRRRGRLPHGRAGADPRARRHRRPLPGRQLRLRLPLGGRRRPVGGATHPARPGLAVDRAEHVRPRRVHGLGRERRRRADDGRQPRHPRRRRRPSTCSSTPTTPAARYCRTCAASTASTEPYGIRLWCLGNEMDGPWQIGHKTRRRVRPARRRDRQGDAAWSTRASSWSPAAAPTSRMPTFGRVGGRRSSSTPTTHVDYISLHAYYEEIDGDLDSFLASAVDMDAFIDGVVATADHVGGQAAVSRKRLKLSFDEWNVWYQARLRRPAPTSTGPSRPRLIEDDYTVADAVVVGSLLITPAAARRPGRRRLPGPAGQRHRADPHRARRPGLAADHLPPVRPDRPARPRRGAARRARSPPGTTRAGTARSRRCDATATYDDETGDVAVFAVNRGTADAAAGRGRPARPGRPARRPRGRRAPRPLRRRPLRHQHPRCAGPGAATRGSRRAASRRRRLTVGLPAGRRGCHPPQPVDRHEGAPMTAVCRRPAAASSLAAASWRSPSPARPAPTGRARPTRRRTRNPVSRPFADTFADPSVIRGKDGWWYAYGTTDPLREGESDPHLHPDRPVDGPGELELRRRRLHRGDAALAGRTAATPPLGARHPLRRRPVPPVLRRHRDHGDRRARTTTPSAMATAPTRRPVRGPTPAPRSSGRAGAARRAGNFLWTFDPSHVTGPTAPQCLFYGSYYGGIFVTQLTDDGTRGDRRGRRRWPSTTSSRAPTSCSATAGGTCSPPPPTAAPDRPPATACRSAGPATCAGRTSTAQGVPLRPVARRRHAGAHAERQPLDRHGPQRDRHRRRRPGLDRLPRHRPDRPLPRRHRRHQRAADADRPARLGRRLADGARRPWARRAASPARSPAAHGRPTSTRQPPGGGRGRAAWTPHERPDRRWSSTGRGPSAVLTRSARPAGAGRGRPAPAGRPARTGSVAASARHGVTAGVDPASRRLVVAAARGGAVTAPRARPRCPAGFDHRRLALRRARGPRRHGDRPS